MPALKVHPGAADRADNLLQAAILSILIDRLTKGDDDPLSIHELSELTVSSPKEVSDAMESMREQGILAMEIEEGQDLSTFEISSLTIALAPVQNGLRLETADDTPQRFHVLGPSDRELICTATPDGSGAIILDFMEPGNEDIALRKAIAADKVPHELSARRQFAEGELAKMMAAEKGGKSGGPAKTTKAAEAVGA